MASLWAKPEGYTPPPESLTTEDEVINCIILGMTLYVFDTANFAILERHPERVTSHHNGKRLRFKGGWSKYLVDLGIHDPSFNLGIGVLDPMFLFSDPHAAHAYRKQLQKG